MNPPGRIFHVVVRTKSLHHKFLGRGGDNILDQRSWEAEPAVVVEPAPFGQCTFA